MAQRGDRKHFIVHADDKPTAFLELERQVLTQAENDLPRHWEIIADNLTKAGWSWGYVSAVDSHGRTIWIVDAHRDGKRFVAGR